MLQSGFVLNSKESTMDEFSDKEVKMTQRDLTFIKATQWDKGWRWGLFVGGMLVAVCNVMAFAAAKFF